MYQVRQGLIVAITAAVAIVAIPDRAMAESTGWVDGHQFETATDRLSRGRKLLHTIRCKAGDKVGQTWANTLLSLTYGENPQKIRWYVAWGDRVEVEDRRLKKSGYTMVSHDSFRRKSGLRIRCAIWYKTR